MKLTIIIAALAAANGVAAGTISFYYDKNCRDLAKAVPAPGGQQEKLVKGGIYGARSAQFTDLKGLKSWTIYNGHPDLDHDHQHIDKPKVNECAYYPDGIFFRAY